MSGPASAGALATQLDRDNPWPGLDSFEEQARDYFHGRDAEADELLRRVADAPLTVLFGKSGLGKTSLLKAGLFPRLREKHFLPVHVRLDIRADSPLLIDQLRDALRGAIDRERVDAPPFGEGETLWEYLHRTNLELWSEQNYQLTPVLVLDQFEEVFTLGERVPERVERFRVDFGDLAENRIPATLANRLATEPATAQGLDLRGMPYKLIVTLREDFLAHLEGWRPAVPSLGRVRVRLLPMRPEQALSAVHETAPHLMDEPLARRIVKFVAAAQTSTTTAQGDGASQDSPDGGGRGGEIEPALLSLFCRGLNEQRKRQGKARFDEQLLEGAQQGIIADYYRSCVEGLPDSVSRFIESDLITEKGFRNSYAKDDAVPSFLTQDQLDRLINRRLLRLEERYGTARVELTHDLLTRAVMAHRDSRRAEEEKAALARRAEEERQALEAQARTQRRRVRAMALVAVVCLALAGFAGWQWWAAVAAKTAAVEARKKAVDAESYADRQRIAAIAAQAKAETEARSAEARRKESLEARKMAEVARTRAEADRRKALDARRTLLSAKLASDSRSEQKLDLSLLLAAAAWSIEPTIEAKRELLWGLLVEPALGSMLHSRSSVFAVAFSPDGKTLASAAGHIILSDVARRTPLGEPLARHERLVFSVAFSPDGTTIASGSLDGTIILWDVARRTPLGEPLRAHRNAVSSVAFSPDGTTLASGSEDTTIILWNVTSRTSFERLRTHGNAVQSVAFSPDGNTLASGNKDMTVILWDVTRLLVFGEMLARHTSEVHSVAFSPDGKTLASASEDTTVILWDVAHRKPLGERLAGHGRGAHGVAFSPDGKTLASASGDGGIILWDVANRTPLGEPLRAHENAVSSTVAFSPDGKTLASGSGHGTITLWDVVHRTLLERSLTGQRGVQSVAFSPDGKTLALGSPDTSIILWDVAHRTRLGEPLAGHKGEIQSVAFSPDGKTLASGSADGTIILWDLARRVRLGEPLAGHTSEVQSVAFSPDGKTLASGSADNTVILWDVDPDSWKSRACFIASRNLTCDEWSRYLFDEPYRKVCPELPGPERCEAQQQ